MPGLFILLIVLVMAGVFFVSHHQKAQRREDWMTTASLLGLADPPSDPSGLLEGIKGFRDAMPRVLHDVYGGGEQ